LIPAPVHGLVEKIRQLRPLLGMSIGGGMTTVFDLPEHGSGMGRCQQPSVFHGNHPIVAGVNDEERHAFFVELCGVPARP
jgi:hypothetical protein